MNPATGRPWVIEDLHDPNLKSEFKYVFKRLDDGRYQARLGGGHWKQTKFNGPRRRTGTEAAQDVCDFLNGSAQPKYVTRRARRTGIESATKKSPYRAREVGRIGGTRVDGLMDVYVHVMHTGLGVIGVKVGDAANFESRARTVGTFGLDAHMLDAIQCPSRDTSLVVEARLRNYVADALDADGFTVEVVGDAVNIISFAPALAEILPTLERIVADFRAILEAEQSVAA